MQFDLASPSPRAGVAGPVLLVAADEDVRLLLRGLLRLLRHRIVQEDATLDALSSGSRGDAPTVLVYVAPPDGEGWTELLAATLRAAPELRSLVLLTAEQEPLRTSTIDAGAQATLLRPFTLREFADAIRELNRGPGTVVANGPEMLSDGPYGRSSSAT